MKKTDIKKTLIFTLAVFVTTLSGALLPLSEGAYVHIGDAAVYVSAIMLPTPLACVASAVGAGAADMLLGSWTYLLPTLIIKPLTVYACRFLWNLIKDKSVADLVCCGAGIVTVAGYFVAQLVIGVLADKENLLTWALDGILFNCVQALASAVVFLLFVNVVRKIYDALIKRAQKKQEEQNESSDL